MSDWAARLLQKPVATRAENGPTNGDLPISANSTSISSKPPRVLKPVNLDLPLQSSPSLSEPFNSEDVLVWANARFSAGLEEARGDKTGDKTVVYRSLESSSSWKTKGPGNGRKNTKDDDYYDLLLELNRSLHGKQRK